MRTGQRRIIATLQRRVQSDGAAGSVSVSFAPVAVIHVGVSTQGGTEFFSARKLNAQLTHECEIRYRADLEPDMRIVYGTTVLDIVSSFDPDEKHRRLVLFCKQVVA